MQLAIRLRRSVRLDEYIRPVICLQLIPCVGGKRALRIGDTPVGSEVQYFACGVLVSFTIHMQLRNGKREKEERMAPLSLGPENVPPVIGIAMRLPRGPAPKIIASARVALSVYRYVSVGAFGVVVCARAVLAHRVERAVERRIVRICGVRCN